MINPGDLEVEVLQWPKGGQHCGTRTGVKVTHAPTGLVAIVETERSQHRNKEIAVEMILGGLTCAAMRYYEPTTKEQKG